MFVSEGLVPLSCTSSYRNRYTPIETAAESRCLKAVEEILNMGANPNSDYASGTYDWPLWIAISNNDAEIPRALL
jgi:ankyrin repeat protein